MKKYFVLTSYYNKYGINDGVIHEVVDERFRRISTHKSKRLAEKKADILNKKLKKKSPLKNTEPKFPK